MNITFTPVIQVYNILGLTDLLKWIHSLKREFEFLSYHFILCTGPNFLDIAGLPQNVRTLALEKIQDYEDTYLGEDIHLAERLEPIKTILKEEFKNSKKNLKQFFQYTRILDLKRGESFKQSLPELHRLLASSCRSIFIQDLMLRTLYSRWKLIKGSVVGTLYKFYRHIKHYFPNQVKIFHASKLYRRSLALVKLFRRIPVSKAWYYGCLVRFYHQTPIAKAWYFSKYQFLKELSPFMFCYLIKLKSN